MDGEMITIKSNKKDLNLYSREIFWFSLKPLIIILMIYFPISIFLIIASLIERDYKFLKSTIETFCLWSIILIVVIRMLFIYRKGVKNYFKYANENGDVEFLIYRENNVLVFKNVTFGTISKLPINEIKKKKITKNCILIKTKGRQILFFPINKDLINLLGNNIKK